MSELKTSIAAMIDNISEDLKSEIIRIETAMNTIAIRTYNKTHDCIAYYEGTMHTPEFITVLYTFPINDELSTLMLNTAKEKLLVLYTETVQKAFNEKNKQIF